jgi:hypothetical protein
MDHGHMLPVRVFMNVHHGLTVSGGARRAQPSRNSVRTLTSIVSHKLKIVWCTALVQVRLWLWRLCVSYSHAD